MRRSFVLAAACLSFAFASIPAEADSPPAVTVASVRRIFYNGEHDAFTDLCAFRGQLYLAFRSCPEGHPVHSSASIIILRSSDQGRSWQQVNRFQVKNRDTRDPHFLVFQDQLFVYTGTWYFGPKPDSRPDHDMNKLLGFAVASRDGTRWSEPALLDGTLGYYIWRTGTYGGKAYLCGRRKPGFEVETMGEGEFVQSYLLESDDGWIWQRGACLEQSSGDETALLFQPDGTLVALARDGGRENAHLLRGRPPYANWQRHDLDRPVGGPLLASWDGRLLVGGRKTTPDRGPKTSLCWLVGTELEEFAELPSGGDNSYPGFVELSPRHALVSYYSSHERSPAGKIMTAIYLADLTCK